MSGVPDTPAFMLGLLRRQLILAMRRPFQVAHPLLFFAMVVALFPLGLGPEPEQLGAFAPGIFWIVALLANLLSSDMLFRSDFEDGSLEQLMLAPQPLFFTALSYILAHWLVTGFALTVLAPLFALMLNLPAAALPVLLISVLLGTAVLSLLGGIGAALTVGLNRGGMLLALLILPFYMPVLIFGSAAVSATLEGVSAVPWLAVLGAMLCLALALAPLAVSAGLRITIDA